MQNCASFRARRCRRSSVPSQTLNHRFHHNSLRKHLPMERANARQNKSATTVIDEQGSKSIWGRNQKQRNPHIDLCTYKGVFVSCVWVVARERSQRARGAPAAPLRGALKWPEDIIPRYVYYFDNGIFFFLLYEPQWLTATVDMRLLLGCKWRCTIEHKILRCSSNFKTFELAEYFLSRFSSSEHSGFLLHSTYQRGFPTWSNTYNSSA